MSDTQQPIVTTMVTFFADDINVNEDDFFDLIKRFENAHPMAVITYRKDGGVNMDEASALLLKNARKNLNLPDEYRMKDIQFGIKVENELSASLNGAGHSGSPWRGYENQAARNFQPWCTE